MLENNSNNGDADRNPQQFLDINRAKDSDFVKETINVYLEQSKIILPVLK